MSTGSVASGRSIPRGWDISPAWMTDVVNKHHPGVEVSSVTRVGGSDGTSSRALFALSYGRGSGPKTLFAKTKGNPLRRFFQRMTENAFIEGRLVESGVSLPLEHPKLYYGAIDYLRLNDMIIMEDVHQRSAILNDATTPLSVDAVANGLRGLARLHSRFWGFTRESEPTLNWVRPWRASWKFRTLIRLGLSRGLSRLRQHLPEEAAALGANGMIEYWVRQMDACQGLPATLLHGDPHVGNTYLLPDGELGFYDWGVISKGHWSLDVGYFLISALDDADRRAHARELVEVYRRTLEVPARDLPSSEEAWLRFRTSPPYGLAI